MEWTFDPLEIKNAFLNIHRLGAIVRRYRVNFYGVSSSRLQGGLPTDRLLAEWRARFAQGGNSCEGRPAAAHVIEERILVPASIYQWKASEPAGKRALAVQLENRRKFQQAFSQGLAVLGFSRDAEGNGVFELGPQPRLDGVRVDFPKERKKPMRIDAIILRELHLPLVRPFETSFGVTRNRRICWPRSQSEGLTGWGECTAGEHPFFSGGVDRQRLGR
jgi:hypothetical protein